MRVVPSSPQTTSRAYGGIAAGVLRLTAGAAVLAWSAVSSAAPVPDEFDRVADRVMPAVVTITTDAPPTATGESRYDAVPSLPRRSPFDRFLRRFGGGDASQSVTALGSGFLVDPDGYVATNTHVLAGAASISVTLDSGEHLMAEIVGTDAKSDVALLKVQADHPLPFISFGASNAPKVGDWVMAVGNPFGLGGTVTAGIVSAQGRQIDGGPFDAFIRTDAAITKGNSGGPMVAMDGTVVGINTAVYAAEGGAVGIGFAVPARLAVPILARLRSRHRAGPGWLAAVERDAAPVADRP